MSDKQTLVLCDRGYLLTDVQSYNPRKLHYTLHSTRKSGLERLVHSASFVSLLQFPSSPSLSLTSCLCSLGRSNPTRPYVLPYTILNAWTKTISSSVSRTISDLQATNNCLKDAKRIVKFGC